MRGYRSGSFDCRTGAHSPHGCVSRSPPIIPDGQISRVRFETPAFFRGPSLGLERFKPLVRIHPFFPWFAPSLVSRPAQALRRFYQAGHPTDVETARRPEPLCPTLVLPPLGRRQLHLLRGRYPPVHAHTGSCATPFRLSHPSAFRFVRRVLAGCTQSLLPTGASRRYL